MGNRKWLATDAWGWDITEAGYLWGGVLWGWRREGEEGRDHPGGEIGPEREYILCYIGNGGGG